MLLTKRGVAVVNLFSGRAAASANVGFDKTMRKIVMEGLETAKSNNSKAVLLVGNGICFSPESMVLELTRKSYLLQPTMAELHAKIESCHIPVVSCFRGDVISWGLELSLASHWRVAMKDSMLGSRDISNGVIPAAGGTQRLPRLIGVENAIRLLTSNSMISIEEAAKLGLIDRVLNTSTVDDFITAAEDFSLSDVVQRSNPSDRILANRNIQPKEDVSKVLLEAEKSVLSMYPGEIAPRMLLDAIRAAVESKSFLEGQMIENLLFEKLRGGSQARALQYFNVASHKMKKHEERSDRVQKLQSKVQEMMKHCAIESYVMLEEGATLEQIDNVLKEKIGLSKGFFELFEIFDLIGGSEERNAVLQMIALKRKKDGTKIRVFDEKELFERSFFPIINEGFKILEASSDYSPEEVDYICVQKFGWPKIKGGPMLFAEKEMKLSDILLSVIHYSEKSGFKERWKPSELLREVVRSGSSLKEELYFKRLQIATINPSTHK